MSNASSPPSDLHTRMTERYASGQIPWQHELPPPEVIALAETLAPGRFLDLGSGLGRACLYMAKHGWIPVECLNALKAWVDIYRSLRKYGETTDIKGPAESAAMEYLSKIEGGFGITRS